MMERYDGDGVDDMPGLLAPVRHWVIGGEWTGFWPSGSAQDYLELLELTRTAARDAYPEVLLGTIPFMLYDVFEGNYSFGGRNCRTLGKPKPGGPAARCGHL